MQLQKTVQFIPVRIIALAFALLAALLLASAAGYIIRGGTPSTIATLQPVAHGQAPDAKTRNEALQQALQQANGFKGPDALDRDKSLRP